MTELETFSPLQMLHLNSKPQYLQGLIIQHLKLRCHFSLNRPTEPVTQHDPWHFYLQLYTAHNWCYCVNKLSAISFDSDGQYV